ncbi:unnamed protein product, partial [Polarella glacialis]
MGGSPGYGTVSPGYGSPGPGYGTPSQGYATPPPPGPQMMCATQYLGAPAHGGVHFTPQEMEYYQQLWATADADGRGTLDGVSGANFLLVSGLPQDILRAIWEVADSNAQGFLTMERFFVALRLVAWAQAGVAPSPERVQAEPPMLPDLPGINRRRAPSETSQLAGSGSRAQSVGHGSNHSEMQPVIFGGEEQLRQASAAARRASSRSHSPARRFTQDRWVPSQREKRKYASLFKRTDWDGDGFIQGH